MRCLLRYGTSPFILILISVAIMTSCGGGGGGTISPPPPASVSVSPATVSVTIPSTQSFTAHVTNSSNTSVSWSIQEGATGGTIDAQGVYTPPSNHTGVYHVIATLQADSSKAGTATATVVAPAPVISTTPSAAAAQGVGYSYAASATDPANSGVTYSLTTSPAGATLTGSTVTWTPDNTQARQSNSFSLKVTSGLGASTTQNWTVTPTGDVTTADIVNYFSESGQSSVTMSRTFTAYVPNGAGGFNTVQSDSNGTFANMPAGYFWLDEISSLVWTKANHIDMQSNAPGRSDLVYPPSQILLTYNLTGLSPTTNGDKIDYFNLNTDLSWSLFPGPPPVGSTSMSFIRPSVDPLSDAAKGDISYISQRSPVTVGDGTFSVIKASTGGLPLTQTGSNQTFDLTLSSLGLNSIFRANAKGASYSALVSKMGAGATDFGGEMEVDAVPFTRYGVVYPVLAKYTGSTITTDTDFGDLSYGDPFPNGWNRMVQYTHTAHVPVQVNAKNFTLSASLYFFSKTLPTATAPIDVAVGPVGNPKINNLPLTSSQTGVGLNPTISWTAPAVGRADYYWVDLVQVSAPFSTLVLSFDGTYITKTTSITLPTGLQAGKTYILEIHAMYDPTFDAETGATADITTLGQADFYSATFTP